MPLSTPWAIVISAVILAVAYLGYKEVEHRRDIEMYREVVQGTSAAFAGVAAAGRPIYQPSPYRVPMLANERCLGGLVVVVNGSSYVQSGAKCLGRMRTP